MDKVLILLSTYNGEKYLPALIASLLKQKDVDLHILVRDDGSKDNTIPYLKTIADKRVEYYIGQNKRAVGSFLELIQKAPLDYDYYAFADQDDVWQEDKISTAVRKLSSVESKKPALYYSGQIITDSDLNVLYKHNLDTKRSVKANCVFNQMAGCTAVFNKFLLQELQKYSPKNIYGHDVWCYRVCAALDGNIIVDSEGKIFYRQHGDNAVGLQSGLKGKCKTARDYIFKYNASSYAEEILNGYSEQLDERWKLFFENISQSNSSVKHRMNILKDSEIDFNSFVLKIIFYIKVLLKKL